MRKRLQHQLEIVPQIVNHEHARELEAMSLRLEAMPEAVDLVYEDLIRGLSDPDTGRDGLSADTVLRVLIVKQMRGFSYEVLSFHLCDSATYRRFCRIGIADEVVGAGRLQENVKKVRFETLEEINRMLLGIASTENVEKGRMVRVDCTVTGTNIHEPVDCDQLWDSVRVLTRILNRLHRIISFPFADHTRRAKRRRTEVWNAKRKNTREAKYRDLLKVTNMTLDYARVAAKLVEERLQVLPLAARGLLSQLKKFIPLAEQVVNQTHRRVVLGEKVPASEKIFSIFEPHTDIIIKEKRKVEFGHKLCVTTGASGLILDLVVEHGNPADSTLAVRSVERQKEIYGRVPRQVAMDGGFASKDNLRDIKGLGVSDMMFCKRRGLKILDMVKSSWVYKKLYRFRAGVEAGISFLKRVFGLRRCTWSGLASFNAYAWGSVLACNLLTLARIDMKATD